MSRISKYNIAVVAHVDHGKSTLCDAIIEYCENVVIKNSGSPILDSHTIEQKRGVTIRNHFIRLQYRDIYFNLIDTPGHYDFSQYVSVGINSANIVLIVIDIVKGIQPQTLSYMNLCIEKSVKVIIVFNKIDIYRDKIDYLREVVKAYFGDYIIVEVSAFKRINIQLLLQTIYDNLLNTSNLVNQQSKSGMYVLDCVHSHTGYSKVLVHLNKLKITVNSYFIYKSKKYKIHKIFLKKFNGYTNIDNIEDDICYVGVNIDTSDFSNLIGSLLFNDGKIYKLCEEKMHTAYTGLLSPLKDDIKLKKAIDKCVLSDPGVNVHKRFSTLYGNTFICAFLGEFHREIFLERLKLETRISFNTCYVGPNYKSKSTHESVIIDYKDKLLMTNFKKYLSNIVTPFIDLNIIFKQEYYNVVYAFIIQHSYNQIINSKFVMDHFTINIRIPFTLLLLGFFNKLKSMTNGYAEFVITKLEYVACGLSLIEFYINNEIIYELSIIELNEMAQEVALFNLEKIKIKLERQQFLIKLMVKINRKTFKSYVIKPYRKDVTAKLYGGDVTRRNKLLNKQKAGKSKMIKYANVGNVKDNIIKTLISN